MGFSAYEGLQTDYRMWKPAEPEWCVVASERLSPDHVVSVQFIKQKPRGSASPRPRAPVRELELEPA